MTTASDFAEFWSILFNWFDTIIEVYIDLVDWFTTPLNEIMSPSLLLPDWLNTVIDKLMAILPDTTVFGLMLGFGLTFFLAFTIIKYFVNIIT